MTKTFHVMLANSLVAFVVNNFVWFAVTLWVYLETKSVIAASVMAVVFTMARMIGLVVTLLAMRSKSYRILSENYGNQVDEQELPEGCPA